MDYASNSHSSKDPKKEKPEKPKVESVTTGEVLIRKKGIGQKFKDVFIATDLKGVTRYVIYDICVPAFQNLVVDSVSRGIDRMVRGDRIHRPGTYGTGVTSYQNYQTPPMRTNYSVVGPPSLPGAGPRPQIATRQTLETDLVFPTRQEAADVLYSMGEIIDQYRVVSVGDFKALSNIQGTHVDENWGWNDLSTAQVRQIAQGFLIDLPQPQPLT